MPVCLCQHIMFVCGHDGGVVEAVSHFFPTLSRKRQNFPEMSEVILEPSGGSQKHPRYWFRLRPEIYAGIEQNTEFEHSRTQERKQWPGAAEDPETTQKCSMTPSEKHPWNSTHVTSPANGHLHSRIKIWNLSSSREQILEPNTNTDFRNQYRFFWFCYHLSSEITKDDQTIP